MSFDATLPEILMLLGDKMVKVHEKDKEIIALREQCNEQLKEITHLKSRILGLTENLLKDIE